jgi:hypothetical protein
VEINKINDSLNNKKEENKTMTKTHANNTKNKYKCRTNFKTNKSQKLNKWKPLSFIRLKQFLKNESKKRHTAADFNIRLL